MIKNETPLGLAEGRSLIIWFANLCKIIPRPYRIYFQGNVLRRSFVDK